MELIKTIVDEIDLDSFVQYHHSSLPSIFKPIHVDYNMLKDKTEKYQDTKFYKLLNLKDDLHEFFLLDTIASYENYQEYIKDLTISKDHTFLWDYFA
jgi:hypothetical protein